MPETLREHRGRWRLVELDHHPVVAPELVHAVLLEQTMRTPVAGQRERLQPCLPELTCALLSARDEPRTEAALLMLRMHEAVELEEVAVGEARRVRPDPGLVVQHPRALLEVHQPPPAEQLRDGRLGPPLHRLVRGGDQLVDRGRVLDGCAADAEPVRRGRAHRACRVDATGRAARASGRAPRARRNG